MLRHGPSTPLAICDIALANHHLPSYLIRTTLLSLFLLLLPQLLYRIPNLLCNPLLSHLRISDIYRLRLTPVPILLHLILLHRSSI